MVLAKPRTASFSGSLIAGTRSTTVRTMFAFRMLRRGFAQRFPPNAGLPPSRGPTIISVTKRGSAGSKLYDSRPSIPSRETYPFWAAMPARVPSSSPVAAVASLERVGLLSRSSSAGGHRGRHDHAEGDGHALHRSHRSNPQVAAHG